MTIEEQFCSYCDTKIFENDRRCPNCGAPTKQLIKKQLSNGLYLLELNKIVALAIAGGGLGISLNKSKCAKPRIVAIFSNSDIFNIPGDQLQFSVSDEKIAKINGDGSVCGRGRGTCVFKVSLISDPSINSSCNILVE